VWIVIQDSEGSGDAFNLFFIFQVNLYVSAFIIGIYVKVAWKWHKLIEFYYRVVEDNNILVKRVIEMKTTCILYYYAKKEKKIPIKKLYVKLCLYTIKWK